MKLLWDQLSFGILTGIFLAIGSYVTFKFYFDTIKKVFKKPEIANQTEAPATKAPSQLDVVLNGYLSFNNIISFMGFFVETYHYGGKLLINLVSVSIGYIFSFLILHPFMYDLKDIIKSPYEYLEKRYANRIICRVITAFIASIFHFAFSTLFLWSNANILSTIFPTLELWKSILIIGSVSGLFSITGGLRQYTSINIFQFLFFLTGLVLGLAYTIQVNSVKESWSIAKKNDRINFIDTSGDLQTRYTFWNQIFSLPIPWCTFHGLLLPNFNRYKQINRRIKSRFFLLSNLPIMWLVNGITIFSSLLAYSVFSTCDPYSSSRIQNKNQLSAYWLLNVLNEHVPSFAGFCLSAVLVYAMMSHSIGLSCSVQIFYNDILTVVVCCGKRLQITERVGVILKAALNLFLSIFSILFAMSFQNVRNSILSLFFLFNNSLNSPILGMFLLSMFNPIANHVGASLSFLISVTVNIWLAFSAVVVAIPKSQELRANIHGCRNDTDQIRPIITSPPYPTNPTLYYLYTVSSIWYCVFSLLFILIFGSLFSIIYSLIAKRSIDIDADYEDKHKLYMFNFEKHFVHAFTKTKKKVILKMTTRKSRVYDTEKTEDTKL